MCSDVCRFYERIVHYPNNQALLIFKHRQYWTLTKSKKVNKGQNKINMIDWEYKANIQSELWLEHNNESFW